MRRALRPAESTSGARTEQKIRGCRGKLGSVAVFLSDGKQSTTAWRTGAVGEEVLGSVPDRLSGERDFSVLHHRRVPGSRANIDDLVINAAGIWVRDTKKYKGRPSKRVDGGFFRPAVARLTIGGRDGTKLIDGVLGTSSWCALCFIDADGRSSEAPSSPSAAFT